MVICTIDIEVAMDSFHLSLRFLRKNIETEFQNAMVRNLKGAEDGRTGSMAMLSGTDGLEVPTIHKAFFLRPIFWAYFVGLCKRISHIG